MNEIPKIVLDYQKQLQQKYLENEDISSLFNKISLKFNVEQNRGMNTMQNSSTSTEMPKYRCIKDVWALKIKSISFDEIEQKSISEDEEVATITPEEEGFAPFRVSFGYCNKHNPQKGGYYVVYKDGYKSFSPAKAFEEGYVRI